VFVDLTMAAVEQSSANEMAPVSAAA